jgi:hypothetical protein
MKPGKVQLPKKAKTIAKMLPWLTRFAAAPDYVHSRLR